MSDRLAAAFQRAAAAREAIARIVADTEAGTELADTFSLADRDPLVGRVFAVKVFQAVPGIGKVRARRTMAALGLDDDVTLAAVSGEVRAQIVEAFRSP